MRGISYLQVLLLLGVLAYLLLVALENPAPLRFPLPMGRGELLVPGGLALGGFLLLGGLYTCLLFLPTLISLYRERGRQGREYRRLENLMASTLQARLGTHSEVQPPELPGRQERGSSQDLHVREVHPVAPVPAGLSRPIEGRE